MAKTVKKKSTKKTTKASSKTKSKVINEAPSPFLLLFKFMLPYLLFVGFIVGSTFIAKARIKNLSGIGAQSYTVSPVKGISDMQNASLQIAIQNALHSSINPYSPFGDKILPSVYKEIKTIAGVKQVHYIRRLYESNNGHLRGKLSLNLSWRKPWVQVQNKGSRIIWIDQEGFCLPDTNNFRNNDVPLIKTKHGFFKARTKAEKQCKAPWQDRHLQKAISLLLYLQDTKYNVPFKVRDIVVEYPTSMRDRRAMFRGVIRTNFIIHTTEGYAIRWGAYNANDNSFEPHRRKEVLNTVRKLIAGHRAHLEKVDYFDVSAIDGSETVSFK